MSDIQRAAERVNGIVEAELYGGFLREVAEAKVAELPSNIAANEIAAIIVPEPAPVDGSGVVLEPRWTFVDSADANNAIKSTNEANSSRILEVAGHLGMRLLAGGERKAEATERIDPGNAYFVVEGGGNKTSVVRRGIAEKAMRELYGDDLRSKRLVQVGSGRIIPVVRKDDTPNPEHGIIRGLAGDLLPAGDSFTEFEANLATALADGYEIDRVDSIRTPFLVSRMIGLVHSDPSRPMLAQIQPNGPRFDEALDALRGVMGLKQLVVATNGQYRPKIEFQTILRSWEKGLATPAVVALGDEPGDTFSFAGSEIVVPNRPASAYINDMVVLWRLAQRIRNSRD